VFVTTKTAEAVGPFGIVQHPQLKQGCIIENLEALVFVWHNHQQRIHRIVFSIFRAQDGKATTLQVRLQTLSVSSHVAAGKLARHSGQRQLRCATAPV